MNARLRRWDDLAFPYGGKKTIVLHRRQRISFVYGWMVLRDVCIPYFHYLVISWLLWYTERERSASLAGWPGWVPWPLPTLQTRLQVHRQYRFIPRISPPVTHSHISISDEVSSLLVAMWLAPRNDIPTTQWLRKSLELLCLLLLSWTIPAAPLRISSFCAVSTANLSPAVP